MRRLNFSSHSTLTALLLLAGSQLLPGTAVKVHAQSAQTDSRWLPFLGCWEPAVAEHAGAERVVCVTPASGAAAEVATVENGKIISREQIDASGVQRTNTKDDCNGWQQAQWSPSADRLYLRSEYTCAAGLKRTTNGLLSLTPKGEWLEVQGVSAGSNGGVRVVRYRETADFARLPAEIVQKLSGRNGSVQTARIAATGALTNDDVIDAVKNVDAAVVEAWLVERGEGFHVDGKQLVQLADANVPPRVVDVMVALSYPSKFTLNRRTLENGYRAPATPDTRVAGIDDERPDGRVLQGGGGEVYGWDPFFGGYRPGYGYGRYGYDGGYGYGYGYGYSRGPGMYGYGYNPYYGWYNSPVIVITQPGSGDGSDHSDGRSHGRVVRGRGYTRDRDRDRDGGSDTASSALGSSRTSSSDSGSSSSSGSGSSSDSGRRTAQPRN